MFSIEKESSSKLVVNRSKFLGFVYNCKSVEDREKILSALKSEYYDCNHITYAHVFWDGQNLRSYSTDDREPSGTAGIQILNLLKSYKLINVLCIVVRYFGGVKLGVQNLSKAYKQCADETLNLAKLNKSFLKTKCKIECDYNQFNKLNKMIDLKDSKVLFDNVISLEVLLTEEEISKAEGIVKSIIITNEKFYS